MEQRIVMTVKRIVDGLKKNGRTLEGVWFDRNGSTDLTVRVDEKTRELVPICGVKLNILGTYRFEFKVDTRNEGIAAVIPSRQTVISRNNYEGETLIVTVRRNEADPEWLGRVCIHQSGYLVHVQHLHDDSAKVRITTYMAETLDGKPMAVINDRYEGIVPMYEFKGLDPLDKIVAIRDKLLESPKMVGRFAEDLAAGVVAAYGCICGDPAVVLNRLDELIPKNILPRFERKARGKRPPK